MWSKTCLTFHYTWNSSWNWLITDVEQDLLCLAFCCTWNLVWNCVIADLEKTCLSFNSTWNLPNINILSNFMKIKRAKLIFVKVFGTTLKGYIRFEVEEHLNIYLKGRGVWYVCTIASKKTNFDCMYPYSFSWIL